MIKNNKIINADSKEKTLYLVIPKFNELVVPLCGLLHELGIDDIEFDREYLDVNDKWIRGENNKYLVDLIASRDNVYLLLTTKQGFKGELKKLVTKYFK